MSIMCNKNCLCKDNLHITKTLKDGVQFACLHEHILECLDALDFRVILIRVVDFLLVCPTAALEFVSSLIEFFLIMTWNP